MWLQGEVVPHGKTKPEKFFDPLRHEAIKADFDDPEYNFEENLIDQLEVNGLPWYPHDLDSRMLPSIYGGDRTLMQSVKGDDYAGAAYAPDFVSLEVYYTKDPSKDNIFFA